MVTAPAAVPGLNVMLRLQQDGNAGANLNVYNGEVQPETKRMAQCELPDKRFCITDQFDIDLMKIWIKTTDSQSPEGEYGIWLDNIVLHTKSGASVIITILWVLLIMILLVLAAERLDFICVLSVYAASAAR